MSVREVLLYNPRSSAARKPVLPMSLLALGAVIAPRFRHQIVDGNLEADPLAALERVIAGRAADLVLALTVMPGPQLAEAVPLCRELKRRHPRLTVIWGGYFPTQHWESCLRSPYVDYVVRGHGELVFAQLLERLDAGTLDPAALPGLAYRDGDVPRSNPLAPIPHPAELPAWDLDTVDFPRYPRRTFLGNRTVGYHSSYGCPFLCNFCAVVNLVNGRWLAQEPDQVAAALSEYRGRGVDAVEFCDNNFFTHEARVVEISRRLHGQGLAFWGEGRVDTLLKYSESSWRTMVGAGLRMIFLGAESASAETLARMDKGGSLTPDMTLELVRVMRGHGVVPELSFVLGNPPDPAADIEAGIGFVRKIKQLDPGAEIILYLYTPVPLEGTLLEDARQHGFAFPRDLDAWVSPQWQAFSQRRSSALPWVGDRLERRVRDFERVLNARYPSASAWWVGRTGRSVLHAASAWRWQTRRYTGSLELAVLQRLLSYSQPEASGF